LKRSNNAIKPAEKPNFAKRAYLMSSAMLRRVLLVAGFAVALTAVAQAQTQIQVPEIYGMQNKQAPQPQAPTGQIPSDSRFVLSDDFKTCSKDTDCMPFSPTCDTGTPRCCDYQSINRFRVNDMNSLKEKMCSTSAIHPRPCTICVVMSTLGSICNQNKCVITTGDSTNTGTTPSKNAMPGDSDVQ
jgi:hypothetical protein